MDILDFAYYYTLIPFFRFVFSVLFKTKIISEENIPQEGVILAANHTNFLDGPLIACVLGKSRRSIYWIISKMIYNIWYLRPIFIIARSVPVNGSVGMAEKLLKKGNVVGIFPEGAICYGGLVKKGRKGIAVLARKTGAPVLPCYIQAVLNPKKKFSILPKFFTPLKITFGKPIHFDKYPEDKIPDDILEDTLNKIIASINVLSGNKIMSEGKQHG